MAHVPGAAEHPKVIVVMPAYNAELTVERTYRDLPEGSVDEVILVGDHRLDMMTAVSAGCRFVGVRTGARGDQSWGDQKPEVLLESVSSLPDYLRDL